MPYNLPGDDIDHFEKVDELLKKQAYLAAAGGALNPFEQN